MLKLTIRPLIFALSVWLLACGKHEPPGPRAPTEYELEVKAAIDAMASLRAGLARVQTKLPPTNSPPSPCSDATLPAPSAGRDEAVAVTSKTLAYIVDPPQEPPFPFVDTPGHRGLPDVDKLAGFNSFGPNLLAGYHRYEQYLQRTERDPDHVRLTLGGTLRLDMKELQSDASLRYAVVFQPNQFAEPLPDRRGKVDGILSIHDFADGKVLCIAAASAENDDVFVTRTLVRKNTGEVVKKVDTVDDLWADLTDRLVVVSRDAIRHASAKIDIHPTFTPSIETLQKKQAGSH